MASLPSPTQVAGPHYPIYEAYYNQIDPQNTGTIAPLDAARFLKKSKLSDIVLGKIWDLSDPNSRGFLNKDGFFVALKLCALAQSGRGISMDNITAPDVPQPKMGDIPKIPVSKVNADPAGIDWSVKTTEKAKYDQLFDSLQPANGVLPGKKVRGVLMESKLPVDMLGKIWDLADLDKDGNLSRHEFMIAMHLVYKALEKHAIPNSLPPELLPAARRKESSQSAQPDLIMPVTRPPPVPVQPIIAPIATIPPQPSRPPLPPQPSAFGGVISQQPTSNTFSSVPAPLLVQAPVIPQHGPIWVVSQDEKMKYDLLFAKADADHDGFVSGLEIKDTFLQSGLPQSVLAHIWSLCDTTQSGKLNNEQFALAMWLMNRKIAGMEPPVSLSLEMIPPSLRSQQDQPPPQQPQEPVSLGPQSTPELDMLATDIRELTRERMALESDIAQKEAELRVKDGEVRSLQSELDTLAATLKQLENQKGEAQKRLNDLKSQKSAVELELTEVIMEIETEQTVVDKLRSQAEEQEASLRSQENELSSKKQELEGLKQEEQRLETTQDETKKTLDKLVEQLQESQLQISQVKAKVNQLEEIQRQMNEAVAVCEEAVANNDASAVPDTALSIGPDHRDSEISRLAAEPKAAEPTFNGDASFDAEFPNDAFSNPKFENSDPFGSAFSEKPTTNDAFSAFGSAPAKNDPFAPLSDNSARTGAKTPADAGDKDPFGCDPFANLHAPERSSNPPARPESPSPALPPKKAKQPPPRPAPPRPAAPSMRAAPVPPTPSPDPTSDPFASSSGFDDFANFDGKFASPSTATRPTASLRPVPHVTSSSSSASPSPVAAMKNRYEAFEFTEDPFMNYRYEDVFSIADPFADGTTTATANATKPSQVDPFTPDPAIASLTDAFEAKFPKLDAFDDDDPFGGDFAKADVFNGNKADLNLFNGKDKFSDNNANAVMGKMLNVEPFLNKNGRSETKPDIFISTEGLFGKRKTEAKTAVTNDFQLEWAEKESIRMEQERRQREERERSDLEMAIALSKKENSEKKSFRNLLRRNKNTPTT